MQVAVIGGGVVGVCTAYFLAQSGHEVVVLERYGNVAQEASFGPGGLVSPGLVAPLAAPGAPRRLLNWLSRTEAPVLLRPAMEPALWHWLRRWYRECDMQRFQVNKERAQRLTSYSLALLRDLRDRHQLKYEHTRGVMQLLRTPLEQQMTEPSLAIAMQAGINCRLLDPDAARQIEPTLSATTPLAAALLFPDDESGNCALFTRQLRHVAQESGVEFHFNSTVDAISRGAGRVEFLIGARKFSADAVVLATGADASPLLRQIGLSLPIYPVKGFSATTPIKNFDQAPMTAIHDEAYQISITRLGNRLRVAGIYEIGKPELDLHPSAVRTLVKCGDDWFPDAANYNSATFWCGARAMLPDGVPLIGASPARNVYLNIAHGSHGWAMAPGAGKIIADLISGRLPEIDMDGLTVARYG